MIAILHWLVRLLYGLRIFNREVLDTPGPVLLLPNHVSWWDWLFIGVCLDSDWKFVTSIESARASWFHHCVMVNRRTFPIDINSPYAMKHIAEYLQAGGRLVMFPEGRLSRTGSLMKLFDGTGFLLAKTNARVVTACIRSANRLPFSPNPLSKRWFPRVSVHFSAPLRAPEMPSASVSETRLRLTDWVYSRMIEQQFQIEMEMGPATLPEAILQAAREAPGKIVLHDSTDQRLSYRRLIIGANLLSREWNARLKNSGPRVGVLLPNVNAIPAVLLSLWTSAKVPAVLNYSSGIRIVITCAKLAGLKRVITSRLFLDRLGADEPEFHKAGIELICLEDVRSGMGVLKKARAFLGGFPKPSLAFPPRLAGAEDVAVVLFTSGSEGIPKGVELTHRNLLANIGQMLSVIDLVESDRFFNALPLFHSFGLVIGLLLPLTARVFTFLYISPLHYRVVPSLFYQHDCTIFFGTNVFLQGYARKADPYDFRSLRYVFAGAEKLQPTTSEAWMQKFGARILEGYGATECSPCLAANTPLRARPGTVGRFLPGIDYRIEPVEGLTEPSAGRLLVRGPNIMRGYLQEGPEPDLQRQDWYDTGDIASVDADGFVRILGRLKRFAKISGEMVSLAAIEAALSQGFPEFGPKFAVAVLARPDEEKGERLLLVTNEPRLDLSQARRAIRAAGLSNLSMPATVHLLGDLPRLGSGKVNYRELEAMIP
ncbi:MAG TPA: AMP-binding protein [Verrucomicrobiae bacterium]|nr:AMP-binding protein [Verrucomicrobiae bacterium]